MEIESMASGEKLRQIKDIDALRSLPSLNAMAHKVGYGFSPASFGNMSLKWGANRDGGEAKVWRNRALFARMAGFELESAVFMVPCHGTDIVLVGHADAGGENLGKVDGLITAERNVPLVLLPADCTPIIVTNKSADFVALIHAGRVGTDLKIAGKLINQLRDMGFVDVNDFVVGLGPAIECEWRQSLETVDPEGWLPFVSIPAEKADDGLSFVITEIESSGEAKYKIGLNRHDESFFVDMVGYSAAQVVQCGVDPVNVSVSGLCTVCNGKNGLVFSHRLSTLDPVTYPESRYMAYAVLK